MKKLFAVTLFCASLIVGVPSIARAQTTRTGIYADVNHYDASTCPSCNNYTSIKLLPVDIANGQSATLSFTVKNGSGSGVSVPFVVTLTGLSGQPAISKEYQSSAGGSFSAALGPVTAAGDYAVTIIQAPAGSTDGADSFSLGTNPIPLQVAPAVGTGTGTGTSNTAIPSTEVSLPNPIRCADATCLVSQVIRYILGTIAVIATLMFIWGGVMMLTSGGNAEQVKKAKETLVWATIGIIVILISWAVIRFVLAGISGTST